MKQVIAIEIESVDNSERRGGSLDLGHRNGAIQRDERAWHELEQLVVELKDLLPVRGAGGRRVAVGGIDRRLDLVRARLVAPKALPHDRLPLGDEGAIPGAA